MTRRRYDGLAFSRFRLRLGLLRKSVDGRTRFALHVLQVFVADPKSCLIRKTGREVLPMGVVNDNRWRRATV